MSDRYHDDQIGEILGDEAVWAEPPGDVEPKILSAITGTGSNRRPTGRDMKRPAGNFAIAAVVSLVALVGVFALASPWESSADDGITFAVAGTSAAPDAGGSATVGPADGGWWVRLDVTGLAPAPDGSYYAGWVSNGEDSVSIGTFHMRAGDSVGLWSGVPLRDFPNLIVTLETLGGGPLPSQSVMLAGMFMQPAQ